MQNYLFFRQVVFCSMLCFFGCKSSSSIEADLYSSFIFENFEIRSGFNVTKEKIITPLDYDEYPRIRLIVVKYSKDITHLIPSKSNIENNLADCKGSKKIYAHMEFCPYLCLVKDIKDEVRQFFRTDELGDMDAVFFYGENEISSCNDDWTSMLMVKNMKGYLYVIVEEFRDPRLVRTKR